jgi:hypothetical protein
VIHAAALPQINSGLGAARHRGTITQHAEHISSNIGRQQIADA